MTLAEYLYDARLTNAAFAARVGVSHTTVSRWLSGVAEPGAKQLLEIIRASDGRITPASVAPRLAADAAVFVAAEVEHKRRAAPRPDVQAVVRVPRAERRISATGV